MRRVGIRRHPRGWGQRRGSREGRDAVLPEAADPAGAGELDEEAEGLPTRQSHPGQAGAPQEEGRGWVPGAAVPVPGVQPGAGGSEELVLPGGLGEGGGGRLGEPVWVKPGGCLQCGCNFVFRRNRQFRAMVQTIRAISFLCEAGAGAPRAGSESETMY